MIAIEAHHLGKRYRLGRRRADTLRDALARLLAAPVPARFRGGRRPDAGDADPGIVWALRDLSFEVEQGAAVGIIGRNGAGKSTLLKLLSRITEPTEGEAHVRGRVGSLLEVGSGFHPDLTGRENVYLNGAILGMRRAEIDRTFDEIVAFAEIDRFVDTQVKFYSTGMYMRLAFAVAAHLETEILVVDEVLAVGDAPFQKKCLGRMDAVTRQGRTVLFVSHNMDAVQRLCNRGLLLDHGRLLTAGPIATVVQQYRQSDTEEARLGRFDARIRSGTGWARITDARIVDSAGRRIARVPCDHDINLELDLSIVDNGDTAGSLRGLVLETVISAEQGQPLLSLMNVDDEGVELPASPACTVRMRLAGPTFVPGRYRLTFFLGLPYLQHVDEVHEALEFEILPPEHPWRPYELHTARGVTCRKGTWTYHALDSQTVQT